MNALQDLGSLKRHWQAQPSPRPDLAALRERLDADNRAHWRTLALVTFGTVLLLAVTLLYALRSRQPTVWFGFAFTATFAGVVWGVGLWLSRGTWRPRDESLAAHLDVSIRRCRSVIIAAPVGVVLYLAGLAGSLAWKQRLYGVDWAVLLEAPSVIIAGWIGAPIYTFAMLWNARRQRQRLRAFVELKRQLGET